MHRILAAVLLVATLLGCGSGGTVASPSRNQRPTPSGSSGGSGANDSTGDSSGSTGDTSDPGEPPSLALADRTWSRIDFGKRQADDVVQYVIDLSVEAAKASNSNALVTSGTLVEDANGVWRHTATTNGPLVVHWADGDVYEITFGTLSPTSAATDGFGFTFDTHEISVAVEGPAEWYQVYSKKAYGKTSQTSKGYSGGCTYDVKTAKEWTSYGGPDGAGASENADFSGSIDCGAEKAQYVTSSFYDMNQDTYDTISGRYDTFEYAWQDAAGAYSLPDGELTFERNRVGPTEFQGSGTIYRNGVMVGGHYTEAVKAGTALRTTEYVELEGWRFPLRTETIMQ